MEQIILTLPVRSEEDIAAVHEHAMFIGSLARLSKSGQLNFACRVTQHCFSAYGEGEEVQFSIHQLEDRVVLRASTMIGKARILVEVPQYIPGTIDMNNPLQAVENTPSLSPAVIHEIKSCVARIKLATSLALDQESSPLLQKYIDVIQRSCSGLEKLTKNFNPE